MFLMNEFIKKSLSWLTQHPDGDKQKHGSELRKEDMAHARNNFILNLGLLLWQIKIKFIIKQFVDGLTTRKSNIFFMLLNPKCTF